MADNNEVAKDILVAAIQKGLVLQVIPSGKTSDEINKATAESIGEMYKIIFRSVKNP